MNIFQTIKELLFPKPKYFHTPMPLNVWNTEIVKARVILAKSQKIDKLNEDIKNLQLSIAVAKKQKKKHSHLLHEMAVLKAEIMRLEA